jgi:hypothetical protein
MRTLLTIFFALGLFVHAHAADAVTGKVFKVLPLFVDEQKRIATSPSLFDRDAYQSYLYLHPTEVSAIRYDVLWKAPKNSAVKYTLRLELRGVGEASLPKLKTLETEVTAGTFRKWNSLTLAGDDFKHFGHVVAWHVTLWDGTTLLGEQKSFLW